MKQVTVFGSAKCPVDSEDYQLAYQIGRVLGQADLNLINGGYSGVMEASAKGALEGGSSTTGVTLKQFTFPANQFIQAEVRAESYWERLDYLIQKGDAYVVLKGGTGTFVELAMVAELMLKDFSEPRPILVYNPFWRPVIETLRGEIDAPDPRFSNFGTSKVDALFTFFDDVEEFSAAISELK